MATLIGEIATLPLAPVNSVWNRFSPNALSALAIAGLTVVPSLRACTTAGGGELLDELDEGIAGSELIVMLTDPPHPANWAVASNKPIAVLEWKLRMCCRMVPPRRKTGTGYRLLSNSKRAGI